MNGLLGSKFEEIKEYSNITTHSKRQHSAAAC
jgi:hypothetical protein